MAKEVLELEVKSDIGKTTKEADKLAKSIDKSTANTKELRDASRLGVVGFGKLRNAVSMVGVALKALGIGLIVGAFATLKQLFEQNQKVLDFFNTAFKATSILFRDLLTYLENNIGSFVTYMQEMFEDPVPMIERMATSIRDHFLQSLVSLNNGIVQVAKSLKAFMEMRFKDAVVEMDLAALHFFDTITGVEGSVEKLKTQFISGADKLKDYVSTVLDTAEGMTELANAAQLAEVEYAKLNAQFLRDAELQRQIRDNVSLTFKERIQANKDLGDVLAEQAKLQKAQVQIQIDAAQAQVNLNNTIENRVILGQAENAMLELQETITGQISEQKTNQIGLEEELRLGIAQTQAEGMSGLERELQELKNAYDEKKKLAIQSGMDTTAITKKFEKDKTKLVQENANEQAQAFGDLAGALSALAGDNKALAVASAVIDTYVGATKAFAQGGVAGFVTGAAVVAAGLSNVKTILSTDVPGGGGGGGGGAAAAAPAPQMMSGAFDLTGGVAPEPVKAFVVTDEMTSSQNQLANIRRRATI